MKIYNNIKLLGELPNSLISLTDKLKYIPDGIWDTYDKVKPNNFGVFKNNTQHIVFRFVNDIDNPKIGYTNYKIYDLYKTSLLPIMNYVSNFYNYTEHDYSRIMLAKLNAHSRIPKHVDGHMSSVEPHKLHIPLVTHEDILFYSGDEIINMEVNNIYEINNELPHGVINDSEINRVHLIIELYEVDN